MSVNLSLLLNADKIYSILLKGMLLFKVRMQVCMSIKYAL